MTREEFNQKKVWLWRYQRSRNHERQLRQQIQSERERATATTKALSPVVVSAGGKIKSRMPFAESWSVRKLYTSRLLKPKCKGKKSKPQ